MVDTYLSTKVGLLHLTVSEKTCFTDDDDDRFYT